MTPTPTIHNFDFGTGGPLELPADEPPPSRWLMYTAWHINRALEFIKQRAVSESYTIPHILAAFKVLAPAQPREAQLTSIRNSKLSVQSSHSFA